MISNREKREDKYKGQCHYLAVKKLSSLLKGITSTHYGDFYCLKCFHSFRKKTNLNRITKYAKIKIF